jgi:hypothetical protein
LALLGSPDETTLSLETTTFVSPKYSIKNKRTQLRKQGVAERLFFLFRSIPQIDE